MFGRFTAVGASMASAGTRPERSTPRGRFSESALQQLREPHRLRQLLAEELKLDRSGRAVCPFHGEGKSKDRDFAFLTSIGKYTCYNTSCPAHGRYGDIVDYTILRRNVDFPTAVRDLAATFGVDLGAVESTTPQARSRVSLLREGLTALYDHARMALWERAGGDASLQAALRAAGCGPDAAHGLIPGVVRVAHLTPLVKAWPRALHEAFRSHGSEDVATALATFDGALIWPHHHSAEDRRLLGLTVEPWTATPWSRPQATYLGQVELLEPMPLLLPLATSEERRASAPWIAAPSVQAALRLRADGLPRVVVASTVRGMGRPAHWMGTSRELIFVTGSQEADERSTFHAIRHWQRAGGTAAVLPVVDPDGVAQWKDAVLPIDAYAREPLEWQLLRLHEIGPHARELWVQQRIQPLLSAETRPAVRLHYEMLLSEMTGFPRSAFHTDVAAPERAATNPRRAR